MRNEFLKKAAAVMTAATMLGTSAFAAVTIKDNGVTYDSTTKQLTVQYDGVDASKQASLLVYNVSAALAALSDDVPAYGGQVSTPIVAIDQVESKGSFTAVLPDGLAAGDKLAVKVGATGETTPASELFAIPSANVAYGDVDNNGEITPLDAAYVFSKASGKLADDAEPIKTVGVAEFAARADVDGNGEITPLDAAYIFSKASGKLAQFPAEENGGGDTPTVGPTETAGPIQTEAPTPDVTTPPVSGTTGVINTVDTSAFAVDTTFDAETPVSDTVSVGVAEVGSVSVVADEVKGNVIKLEDGGTGQSSLKFDLTGDIATVAEGEETVNAKTGIITYKVSYKIEVAEEDIVADTTSLKDFTLLRLSNKAYENALAVPNSDGRVVEVMTIANGANYQLSVKDYFTADPESDPSNLKPVSTKTNITLKPNEWYDIFMEFDANTNKVKIYAKNMEGNVVAADECLLTSPAETPIAATNASVMTKGSNTVYANLYVAEPEFALADESVELPPVYVGDMPWALGECQDVISESTFFNFSEAGSAFDLAQFDAGVATIDQTISWGGLTIYMDPDRDLEWQDSGGTPENHGGSGGGGTVSYGSDKRGYQGNNFTTSLAVAIGGKYSSLFEGMMAKTADGGPVYLIKDDDGTVRRELRIREIQDYASSATPIGYDKDGNEIDLTTLPDQKEKLTDPFEKVIGVKVAGSCWINVPVPNKDGRLVTISTEDGTILNPGGTGLGTAPELNNADGVYWVTAQYTGTEPTEIYVSCPAGGLWFDGIEVVFEEE